MDLGGMAMIGDSTTDSPDVYSEITPLETNVLREVLEDELIEAVPCDKIGDKVEVGSVPKLPK